MTVLFSHALTSAPPLDRVEWEVPSAKSVSFSRAGCKLTLRPGDPEVAGKARCEMKPPAAPWIGFSMRLEKPWKYPSRVYLFQWHDAPPGGTSWKDWPSHPPLFAMSFQLGRYWLEYGTKATRKVGERLAWPSLGFVRCVLGFKPGAFGEAWINGISERFEGPSNYAGAGAPYPKLGIYAPADALPAPLSITVKGLVCATTRAECE